MQPKTHIAYSPATPGCIFSMFYIESDIDIYGWCVHAENHRDTAAYFMLENYYVNKKILLHRSVQADVSGQWSTQGTLTTDQMDCPVPEPMRHELERMQFEFIDHWLFYKNDPSAAAELAVYQKKGLPILSVNIKSKKLNRLSQNKIIWTHTTPGIDLSIVEYLQNTLQHGEQNI